jgi:protein PhnA
MTLRLLRRTSRIVEKSQSIPVVSNLYSNHRYILSKASSIKPQQRVAIPFVPFGRAFSNKTGGTNNNTGTEFDLTAGPCPKCKQDTTYWDGEEMFVCADCSHEWPVDDTVTAEEGTSEDNVVASVKVVKDANGVSLLSGDVIQLVKTLKAGSQTIKKGTKVKKISVGEFSDGHDIDCTIPGLGSFLLKSQFVKKVG